MQSEMRLAAAPARHEAAPELDRARSRLERHAGALVVGLLVAGVYVAALARILLANRALLAQSLPDDAFYYLEVGQRAARGQGPTFDGHTATNGFHPLWQLVVTGLARLTHGDALIKAALVVGLLAAFTGTVLLALAVRRAFGGGPALLALLVGAHASNSVADGANGMESGLVILAVGLVVLAFGRLESTRRMRDAVLLGAACGLLVLARLDFAVVIWMVPAIAVWRMGWLRAGVVAAGGALVCAPYVIWNLAVFGHVLSVSGTVKQREVASYVTANYSSHFSLSYIRFVANLLGDYVGMLWHNALALPSGGGVGVKALEAVLIVLCACGALVLWRRRAAPASGYAVALAAGGAMLVAKTVVDAVASPFWLGSWYAAAQRTMAAVLVGVLLWFAVQPLRRRLRRLHFVPVVAVSLAFVPLDLGVAGAGAVAIDGHNWQGADLQAANWIVAAGPAGRYGSRDAGVLGFFTDGSGASVTDLDGLVTSYAFADLLASGTPPLQLHRAAGIDFLVGRIELAGAPQCGRLLWTSPEGVIYGGGLDAPKVTSVPIRVWDLRACWGKAPD